MPATSDYVGSPVLRREDRRFLTGQARYTEDIVPNGLLHCSIVRSDEAHADIVSIDAAAARRAPGVVAIFTAEDLGDELPAIPTDWILPVMCGIPERYALARDRVRFVGEAVAIVVAETRPLADDAARLIEVEYAPLPVVTRAEQALEASALQLHDDFPGNRAFDWRMGEGDFDAAAARADVVVDLKLINQRVSASPMEGRATIADYDRGTDHLTLHTGTQNVHVVRRNLSRATGIPEHHIRVIAPSEGGGFGAKLCLYPEDALLTIVSRRLGRPVRWAETRSENFVGTSHGRDHVDYVSIAATREGRMLAIKVESFANVGAYVSGMGVGIPAVFSLMASGCYDFEETSCVVHGVFTNTTTTETYRGAGRPEAAYMVERAVDAVAAKLQMDPAELRRRNFVQPDRFPYRNGVGFMLDSGNYELALDKALEMLGYDDARERQAQARREGRLVGIGMGSYVEFCGFGECWELLGFDRSAWEQAVVVASRTGKVTVQVGIVAAGQGHETTIAQLVAQELGLPIEDVDVEQGDTGLVHFGTGTFNSRSVSSAGSAATIAARKVMDKARRIAAHLLEADVEDLHYQDATFSVAGAPGGPTVSFADVSQEAIRGVKLPEGEEPALKELGVFHPIDFTSPFGTHIAQVEVDPDTGAIDVQRYVAVDDAGNVVNPLLATGQVHGGIAQGVGQALYESIEHDDQGQPTTASYMSYCVPRAHHMPDMETAHTITPSPLNPLGAKGIGESGVIGPPPALVNAVLDALRPIGVDHLDMPLTPPRVWAAIQEARR
jgi:carbon-monoxide dehydrogenase large subunit